MRHILHITAHLGGGAGKAISGIVKESRNFQNTVILLEKPVDDHWCRECENAGARIRIAPAQEELIRVIEQADVVVINWWAHPLMVGMISVFESVCARCVLWSHVNGLSYPVLTSGFLSLFDAVMLTSPCLPEEIKLENHGEAWNSGTFHLVYGIGDFDPKTVPAKMDYSTGSSIRIGYIGTLDFAKMSPDYPEVCAGIREKVPDAEFILCGNASERFENSFFENRDLRSSVSFAGFVRDVQQRLLTFDLFLYLLTKDNYATTENAILEAMAAGLPVVCYDNPAESRILEDQKTGILAASKEAAIETVVRLSSDAKERERLGRAARNRVIENYDPEVNGRRFREILESVMNISKHRHPFSALIGRSIWERFLYFCGQVGGISEDPDFERTGDLPEIFRSASKGSPSHFLHYYEDEHLRTLADRIEKEET